MNMKNKMMGDDYENVGIMQGFLDDVGEEEDMLEEEENSDEATSAKMLNRRVDSPEILMNNLRGDMRSVDARREELADLVGFQAASETPDSVLAMLQPVLAQGGGIGALPQSGPMAQGPQPPMPPPPGGAMGAPPPGAPPLPPGGAAPPAGGDMAALLAAAGPPPGGGGAPGGPPMGGPPPGGPMIGPDGQPIPPEGLPPIQMYRGGEVKYFKDGTPDPDGEDDESQENNYSPAEYSRAQQDVLSLLAQQPRSVPKLRGLVEEKLPEYEAILGGNTRGDMRSNILFDIAGAALNYAGNRGPGGEVLRGSPVSRFAGAFSGVPAAIQKRVGELDTARRQLKLLALQASEKEREEIRQENTRLAATQARLLSNFARSGKQDPGVLGGSFDARRLEYLTKIIPDFAQGATTPEDDRRILLTLESYLQPVTRADPASGQMISFTPPVNPMIEQALAARNFRIDIDPNTQSRRIVSTRPETVQSLIERGLGTSGGTATPPGQASLATDATTSTLPPNVSEQPVTALGGRELPINVSQAQVEAPPALTLVDSLGAFGIGPGIRRIFANIPVEEAGRAFGPDKAMMTNARTITADLVAKWTDASRILASERKDIKEAIDTIPKWIGNQTTALQDIVALQQNFERLRDDALRVAADPVELRRTLQNPKLNELGITDIQTYLKSAYKFDEMIKSLGLPPVVQTQRALDQALSQCKPNEQCWITVKNRSGQWEMRPVLPPQQ